MNRDTRLQHIRQAERGSFTDLGRVLQEVAVPAAPVPLPVFTVSTVPAAAAWAGHMIFVSNGAAGDPVPAFSDGTNWLRVDTGTAIAAS